jgi:hypothetical protein
MPTIDNDDSRDLDQLTVAEELGGGRTRILAAIGTDCGTPACFGQNCQDNTVICAHQRDCTYKSVKLADCRTVSLTLLAAPFMVAAANQKPSPCERARTSPPGSALHNRAKSRPGGARSNQRPIQASNCVEQHFRTGRARARSKSNLSHAGCKTNRFVINVVVSHDATESSVSSSNEHRFRDAVVILVADTAKHW